MQLARLLLPLIYCGHGDRSHSASGFLKRAGSLPSLRPHGRTLVHICFSERKKAGGRRGRRKAASRSSGWKWSGALTRRRRPPKGPRKHAYRRGYILTAGGTARRAATTSNVVAMRNAEGSRFPCVLARHKGTSAGRLQTRLSVVTHANCWGEGGKNTDVSLSKWLVVS